MGNTITVGTIILNESLGLPDYRAMVTEYGPDVARSLVMKWDAYHGMIRATHGPADNLANAYAIRLARVNGDEALVMAMIRYRRAGWLTTQTLWQRQWQTKVSRRPQRGRHHDSWAIRESYVACR